MYELYIWEFVMAWEMYVEHENDKHNRAKKLKADYTMKHRKNYGYNEYRSMIRNSRHTDSLKEKGVKIQHIIGY